MAIEVQAVDTYGTVELQSVDLVETPNGDMLESKFRKRLSCGNEIKSKGAFDVLAVISEFELKKSAKALEMKVEDLKQKIADRSFFQNIFRMIANIFTTDNEKRAVVQNMVANEAAYEAISVISGLYSTNEYRRRIFAKAGD